MAARLKDFEDKKVELDLWAITWDSTTENKLRYFENCLPANGENSMRKGPNWGTDPNRRIFIQQAKSEMRRSSRSWHAWQEKIRQSKLSWKRRHLAQISEYVEYIYQQKLQDKKNMSHIETILVKKQQRELMILNSLEKEQKRHNGWFQRQTREKGQQIEEIKNLRKEKKDDEVPPNLDEIFDINLDFSTEDILKIPIFFQKDINGDFNELVCVTEEVPEDFLENTPSTEPSCASEIEQENCQSLPKEDIKTHSLTEDGKSNWSKETIKSDWSEETINSDWSNDSIDTDWSNESVPIKSSHQFERPNSQSPNEWFYPPDSPGGTSANSDLDPFLELAVKTSPTCIPKCTKAKKRDVEEVIDTLSDISKLSSQKAEISDIVTIEDVEGEIALKTIFVPCADEKCCLRLVTADNISTPIPCLLQHINDMVKDYSTQVSIINKTSLSVYFSFLYIFKVFGLGSTRLCLYDLALLNPGIWLNDELINAYGCLLNENANCFVFHSKVFELDIYGTKNPFPDVFTKKQLFFPINEGNVHWYLVYLDMEQKTICILDSLNQIDATQVVPEAARYVFLLYLFFTLRLVTFFSGEC